MTEQGRDPAFEVVEVNLDTGATTIVIQKGIHGAAANQLKDTDNNRKGSSILRKLGYILASCGDLHYGSKDIADTEINPSIVVGNIEPA